MKGHQLSIMQRGGWMKEPSKQELVEQLFQAKEALFSSKTIREAKFWQQKINYLKQKLKENA